MASANGDGIELKDVKVAVLDVNPSFEPLFWRRMAGVIGYDVISRFVVTVNYDASNMFIYSLPSFVPAPPSTIVRTAAIPRGGY